MSDRRWAWLCCAAVFLSYATTMSRALGHYDTAELALVAIELGLGHPLGQPVHTLLGWIASHIPFMPPLVGLNLLSALPAALCVLPVWSIARHWSSESSPTPSLLKFILIYATFMHGAVWEPSTRIEVYALATWLALLGTATLLREKPSRNRKTSLLAGLYWGLSAATTPYPVFLLALSSSWMLWQRYIIRRRFRELGFLILGGVIGMLPFLYIPLIAQNNDAFVWGAPQDLESLLFFLKGSDFDHNREITWHAFLEHAHSLTVWAWKHSWLGLVGLATIRWFAWPLKKSIQTSWALNVLLVAALLSANAIFHPEVTDYLGYLMVPSLLCAASAAAATTVLFSTQRRLLMVAAALIPAGAALLAWNSHPRLFERTRHLDESAQLIARGALNEATKNTIMIVQSDHWVASLLYLQEAEHVRSDIVIMAVGLASSSWYWEHLYRRHPELKSFPMRGPGGRIKRIHRFLAANSGNPVSYESIQLSTRLGRSICTVGWLAHEACIPQIQPSAATQQIEQHAATVQAGSPPTHEVLARIGYDRAIGLASLGYPSKAVRSLIGSTGIPYSHDKTEKLQRFIHADRVWTRKAAVWDPARNLFMASEVFFANDEIEAASTLLEQAFIRQLPEAIEQVASLRQSKVRSTRSPRPTERPHATKPN